MALDIRDKHPKLTFTTKSERLVTGTESRF